MGEMLLLLAELREKNGDGKSGAEMTLEYVEIMKMSKPRCCGDQDDDAAGRRKRSARLLDGDEI